VESLFLLFAFGLLGLLLIGSILGVVSAVRLRAVERASAELKARVAQLEAAARAEEPAGPVAPLALAPEEPAAMEQPLAYRVASPVGETSDEPMASGVPPARSLDLESLIAGRWLNRIGIVAVLLAVAFFLKYAFDNQWVGPMGRVAIGLLAGTGLLVMSQRLLGKGYAYFSEGITALGGGVLFLSIFAAWDFYELIPQSAAFASLLVVTAALGALALGRNSERLAVLALSAGFATPGLIGTDDQIPLFGYLAILVACFLFVAWRKGWRWVAPLAMVGTLIYLFGWYEDRYSATKLLPTVGFATLFFAEFASYLLLHTRVGPEDPRRPRNAELLLSPINAGWYGILLYLMLYQDHRWWLTLATVALGALHLAAAQFVTPRLRAEGEPEGVSAARLLFAGLALTFVTAAIPIRLEGEAITIAWAIEAALLVWAGFRAEVRALRATGVVLLIAVVALLFSQWGPTERLFLNERFASFAVVVTAMGLSTYWARARWDELKPDEQRLFGLVGIAVSAVTVWGLSEEIWYALGRQDLDTDTRFARQMGLSLLWTIAASLLIFVGAHWRSAALRWQGLVLLGITVVKVFLLDLSYLERAYRIASFLVLGVVLLAVSFWYQKSLARAAEEGGADSREEDE